MPLTILQIKHAKPLAKEYKLADSGGIYLLVKPNGGKDWRLKYRFGGKEKLLAIGVYCSPPLGHAQLVIRQAFKITQPSPLGG